MAKKIGIIIYSLYHHIAKLAESVKAGVESSGMEAKIFQVKETLPESILEKLHAAPKLPYDIADLKTLTDYDGFLFGIPTRYGNMPSQLKTFFDGTGSLWASGALYHKPFGVFVSTGTGGGNEMTVVSSLSTFVHHGMIFVPLGYAKVFPQMTNLSEVRGGSPWGAGTIAGDEENEENNGMLQYINSDDDDDDIPKYDEDEDEEDEDEDKINAIDRVEISQDLNTETIDSSSNFKKRLLGETKDGKVIKKGKSVKFSEENKTVIFDGRHSPETVGKEPEVQEEMEEEEIEEDIEKALDDAFEIGEVGEVGEVGETAQDNDALSSLLSRLS